MIHKKQGGATVVESAISLIAMGILFGVVLLFRDMLGDSQVRSQIQQIEMYDSAINTFQAKYRGKLPGDFAKASVFGLGENGNGDSQIGDIIDEEYLFWKHLAKEGLIYVDPIRTKRPEAKIGQGVVSIYFNTSNRFTYYHVGFTNSPDAHAFTPMEAYKIDLKLDDSDPITGRVLAKGAGPFDVFNLPPTKGRAGADNDFCITDAYPEEYNQLNEKHLCSLDIQLKY